MYRLNVKFESPVREDLETAGLFEDFEELEQNILLAIRNAKNFAKLETIKLQITYLEIEDDVQIDLVDVAAREDNNDGG